MKILGSFWFGMWLFMPLTSSFAQIASQCTLSAPANAHVGTQIIFNVKCQDSADVSLAWEFGDESTLPATINQKTVSHTYSSAGPYNVFVRAQGEPLPLHLFLIITNPIEGPAPVHHASVAFDPEFRKIWVVNPDNNSVSVIDVATRKLVWEIEVDENPRSLSIGPDNRIRVVCQNSASIVVLNKESEAIVERITLPRNSRPYAIVDNISGSEFYVSLQALGQILKIRRIDGVVQDTVNVFPHTRGLALAPKESKLLVTRYISPETKGEVALIDLNLFKVNKIIELTSDLGSDSESSGRGVPNGLDHIVITPDGKRAWVTGKKDNTLRGGMRDGLPLNFENMVRTIVCQIDLGSEIEVVSQRVDFNNQSLAGAMLFNSTGSLAFITTQASNQTNVLFTGNLTALGAIEPVSLIQELAPSGLAMDSDTLLFVDYFTSRELGIYNISEVVRNSTISRLALIPKISNDQLSPVVLKGKQIFYNAADPRMSQDAYISCAVCHLEGSSDERIWDFSTQGEGLRNTTSLHGKAGMGQGPLHWSGNFDEVQDFEHPIRNLFGGTGFLSDVSFHSNDRDKPLGGKKAGQNVDLDALAIYVAFLSKARPSPFRTESGALTESALRGKSLFYASETQCSSCHAGREFTDSQTLNPPFKSHDVGTLKSTSGFRLDVPLESLDTPTLKGLWETAPYLHDGSAAGLLDVLVTQNPDDKHGVTSHLTEGELNDLIAFLNQVDESEDALRNGLRVEKWNMIQDSDWHWIQKGNELKITLNPTYSKGSLYIEVRNLLGEIKFTSQNSTFTHSLREFRWKPEWNPGVYLLTVKTFSGFSTQKVIWK